MIQKTLIIFCDLKSPTKIETLINNVVQRFRIREKHCCNHKKDRQNLDMKTNKHKTHYMESLPMKSNQEAFKFK